MIGSCILVLETSKVPESHTSNNIVEIVRSIYSTWGIANKTCGIVCNNAPNMVKAIQTLKQGLLVRCVAHSIQLSINIGIHTIEIKDLINKLWSIVGHFHESAVSQSNLEKEQIKCQLPKTKLVQDCIIRWNSTLDMMSSVLFNLYPINNALILNSKTENWRITLKEVEQMENIIQVLEPFKGDKEILGGDKYVTSSITGRVLKSLLTSLNVAIIDNTLTKNLKKNNL